MNTYYVPYTQYVYTPMTPVETYYYPQYSTPMHIHACAANASSSHCLTEEERLNAWIAKQASTSSPTPSSCGDNTSPSFDANAFLEANQRIKNGKATGSDFDAIFAGFSQLGVEEYKILDCRPVISADMLANMTNFVHDTFLMTESGSSEETAFIDDYISENPEIVRGIFRYVLRLKHNNP